MKKVILLLATLLLISCSTNNDIISGKITKRKYQKGYYVARKSNEQDNLKLYEIHNLTASNNINELLDYSIPPDTLDTISNLDSTLIKIEELKALIELEKLKKQYDELIKQNEEKEVIPIETEQDFYNEEWKYPRTAQPETRIDPVGILSFIFSMTAFVFAGLPFGIAAVIFSIISLARTSYEPDRWYGRGFAILGLFIGLANIIIVLVLLGVILT